MAYAHVREMVVDRDGEVHVRGLPLHVGDRVQVLVIPKSPSGPGASRYPLQGTPVRYDRPLDPAIDPNDWEANQ